MLGEEELGGVFDFAQSVGCHFVDAEFGGGAEAVFDGAEDAVHVLAVAFELQDGVDDVFEDFRSGDVAVFVDVSDEDDGDG